MRFTAFGLLVAIQATSAFAQAPPQPPPRREVKAEFALVNTTGNASTQSIGTGGEVIYRPTPFVFNAKAAFVRNEAEDVETAKSLATLLRGARAITARLQVYAQHGYLSDRFAGINHRNLVDGGIAYVLAQTARHIVSAEGGLGYLIEDRRTGLNLTWRLSQTAALTARIATAWSLKLSNQIRFVNDPVPGFEDTDSVTSAALVLSF
jgi:putative salt-induced outer membrane protein YdiY